MKKILLLLIKAYQIIISPSYPSCCRYIPSCSTYAKKSLETHDLFSAVFYIILRILKCNPFSSYGVDFVPEENLLRKISNQFKKIKMSHKKNG